MWAPPSFGLLILYIVYTAVDTTSCVNTMPRLPAGAARGGNLCTLRGGRRQPLHIALLRRGCDRHTSLPLTRNSTTPTSSVAIHLPVTYADQGFYFWFRSRQLETAGAYRWRVFVAAAVSVCMWDHLGRWRISLRGGAVQLLALVGGKGRCGRCLPVGQRHQCR